MSSLSKGVAAHKSAVRAWNVRAANAGLNWRLASRYEPATAAATAAAASSTKQLVKSLLAVAVASTAQSAKIIPSRPVAALWGLLPGSSSSLPILAPAVQASVLHLAVVFAAGAVVDRVAPIVFHALQKRVPHAMRALQSGHTHPAPAEASAFVASATDGLCLLPDPLRFGECGSAHAWTYRALPAADGSAGGDSAGGRLRSLDGRKVLYLLYSAQHGGGAAKVCADFWCLRCLGRDNGNRTRAGWCSTHETVGLQLAAGAATTRVRARH